MRCFSGLGLLGLVVLSMISLPAKAATVMTMGEGTDCTHFPPAQPGPFVAIPGANGSAIGCFVSTVPVLTLDLRFSAPPDPANTSCSSTRFSLCNVTETAGITDVSFAGAPGVPQATPFEVLLTGFTPGQTVNGIPNDVPEPSTVLVLLLTTFAAVLLTVWRKRARVE